MDNITRYHQAELELSDTLFALQQQRIDAETESGSEALAQALGESVSGNSSQRLAEIDRQTEATKRAVAAARTQRIAAVEDSRKAHAAQLRKEGAKLREEIQRREQKTSELLKALEDFEQCRFVAYEPQPLYRSGVAGDPEPFALPRTSVMRNEAQRLEAEAHRLENQRVEMAGSVGADSADALLEKIRALPATTIGPTLDAVRIWGATAEQEARNRIQTQNSLVRDRLQIRLVLTWQDGTISPARSHVQVIDVPQNHVFTASGTSGQIEPAPSGEDEAATQRRDEAISAVLSGKR